MRILRNIFTVLSAVVFSMTSCLDDRLYDPNELEIGDGLSDVAVTVAFENMQSALESRADGDAVNSITSLWTVIYKVADGKTVFVKKILASSLSDYKVNQDGNAAEPDDKETGTNMGATGETTPHATFTIKDLPYGRYQFYAVANVPSLTDAECETPDKLKSMSFDWKTDIAKNNAMFGYFTDDNNKSSNGFEAPTIVVNKSKVDLHSWIKRLISKVTISFDATQLNESVRIFIKSVAIHDIPATCYLGKNNTPGENDLIKNGEEFKFYTAATADNAQHEKWSIVLSRGREYNLAGAVNHTEQDDALYFFENMQGNYPGQKDYLKVQIPDEVGTPIDKPSDGPDYKDRIENGSYIEVVGFYESKNKEKYSSGPIIYRFMLGKDVTYNYDAERNFHYKLTLKFRGWANEADWHISYRLHEPTMLVPDKYYISYLYHQQLDFPATIKTGSDDVKEYTVKAEIIENNWIPYNENTGTYPPNQLGNTDNINGFGWNLFSYNNIYTGVNYAGFLTLRGYSDSDDVIGASNSSPLANGEPALTDQYGYGPQANAWLNWYYNTMNIAHNEYKLNDPSIAKYDDIDKTLSLTVPMWTRQKEMVPATDFTGNNPFNAYERTATVRFTLYDKNGNLVTFKDAEGNPVDHQDSKIIQVRRVENPKAIYRSHDKADEFNVKLMTVNPGMDTELVTKYTTFKSDGPWRVSIMAQTEDFIRIRSVEGTVISSPGQFIYGSTDDIIEFTYYPKGTIGSNATRCGIIKVEYHDYNCVHLIFVRQGYHAPVYLGDANWSCYNVYATANAADRSATAPQNPASVNVVLTKSPLSIGSFLKRNQYNYSIPERVQDERGCGWRQALGTTSFPTIYLDNSNTVQQRNATWGTFAGEGWTTQDRNPDNADGIKYNTTWSQTWTSVGGESYTNGKTFKVPTSENFHALLNTCKFGYGVVYGDGATFTADNYDDAYSYFDGNNTGVTSTHGVRACVVYEEDNGKNIIFPMGRTGQGRRSRTNGMLTYSGVTSYLGGTDGSTNNYRPLTYNLYRVPGAVYWIDKPVVTDNATAAGYRPQPQNANTKAPNYASWDINYLAVVFNPYDYGTLGQYSNTSNAYQNFSNATSSDALPIKLIYK